VRIEDTANVATDLRSVQLDRTQEAQPESRRAREQGTPQESDSVAVSPLGAQLARAIEQPGPEEISRVEQAQRAEQSGGLDVSDEQLADALIQGALADTSLDAEIARFTQAAR